MLTHAGVFSVDFSWIDTGKTVCFLVSGGLLPSRFARFLFCLVGADDSVRPVCTYPCDFVGGDTHIVPPYSAAKTVRRGRRPRRPISAALPRCVSAHFPAGHADSALRERCVEPPIGDDLRFLVVFPAGLCYNIPSNHGGTGAFFLCA